MVEKSLRPQELLTSLEAGSYMKPHTSIDLAAMCVQGTIPFRGVTPQLSLPPCGRMALRIFYARAPHREWNHLRLDPCDRCATIGVMIVNREAYP